MHSNIFKCFANELHCNEIEKNAFTYQVMNPLSKKSFICTAFTLYIAYRSETKACIVHTNTRTIWLVFTSGLFQSRLFYSYEKGFHYETFSIVFIILSSNLYFSFFVLLLAFLWHVIDLQSIYISVPFFHLSNCLFKLEIQNQLKQQTTKHFISASLNDLNFNRLNMLSKMKTYCFSLTAKR